MIMLRSALICGIALAAAGCAIRPLPQDVTGNDTYRIVAKIRCETREAIRQRTINVVAKVHPEIAEQLKDGSLSFPQFASRAYRKRLHPELQRVLERYDHAAIGYDFTFDITEKHDTDVNFDLLKTYTRGTLKIGLTGANKRERQNTRNFRIIDTFEGLVTLVPDRYCVDAAEGPNWYYPITGTLGLDELVLAFLDLNQSGNLGPMSGKSDPSLADTIEFTTKFSTTANPILDITPVGKSLQLVKVGVKGDVSREDIHKVIIALTLPPEPKKGTKVARTIAEQRASVERRTNNALDFQLYRESVVEQRFLRRQLRQILE